MFFGRLVVGDQQLSSTLNLLKRCSPLLIAVSVMTTSTLAQAPLRGHGGPVRAVVISSDGKSALSGSFDTSAIRWSLTRDAAEQVMRFHAGGVNAVAFLNGGRLATAGADGLIALWSPGSEKPDTVLEGHTAPVVSLAMSRDGMTLASASWDQTVRLWPLAGGAVRVFEGHSQSVNGVAFTPDGNLLVSVSYDQTVRLQPLKGEAPPTIVTLPSPLNAVSIAPDGEIAVGGANGKVYLLKSDGTVPGEVQAGSTPVISLAISPNGALIAAAAINGSVAIIDRTERQNLRALVGPGLPVWAVAFFPDGRTVLTGGADRMIRRWNALTGDPIGSTVAAPPDDPLAKFSDDRGAEIYRACVACHTLSEKDGPRAGPTLAGIFGRKIATLPGYEFSAALKALDIVWTPETVAKLFEVGPMAYTPGTKMPEQRIGSPEDRKALTDFLARAATK